MNYYSKKKYIIIIIFFSFISKENNQSSNTTIGNNLADDIYNHYIKSVSAEQNAEENSSKEDDKNILDKIDKIKLNHADILKISLKDFMGNVPSNENEELKNEGILNKYAWKDLKLFYGTSTNSNYHLISRINNTITNIGEAALTLMISNPTSNVELLKKRQSILKGFLNNDDKVNKIINLLKKYKESEESIFSFWTDKDPFYTKEYKEYMQKRFYYDNEKYNTSVFWLELSKRLFRDYYDILMGPLYPVKLYFGMSSLLSLAKVSSVSYEAIVHDTVPFFYPFYNYIHIFYFFNKNNKKLIAKGKPEIKIGILNFLPLTFINLYYVNSCYKSYRTYTEYSTIFRNLALRLNDISIFLNTIDEIDKIISSSPELEKIYGDKLKYIRELLKKEGEKSGLGRLIWYLKNLHLSKWYYFLHNGGQLLACFKLFLKHKDSLKKAFYDLGMIDATLSFVTLIKKSKQYSRKNNYNFVKFLDRKQKNKPYINIKNMWNPFLDAKEAVSNSIIMDASKKTQNIILSGPNAGGKTTFLSGITISLLLAQTVGIGPVEEIIITPFNKINTYIDILDDIADGKSLFMAEVYRAQQHINIIEKLEKDEFAFSIFDEPFNATNPTEGAAAESAVLEYLSKFENSLNIVATHYPSIMKLEKKFKPNRFANYKVYTKSLNKDKIHYTFKIIPGKSTQTIAIDILQEKGYNQEIIKRAREIISKSKK